MVQRNFCLIVAIALSCTIFPESADATGSVEQSESVTSTISNVFHFLSGRGGKNEVLENTKGVLLTNREKALHGNSTRIDDAEDCEHMDDEENCGNKEWWEDEFMELDDMWEEIECDEILSKQRPIHNLSTWMFLRGAYRATLGPRESTISVSFDDGFNVPIEVKHSKEKGRGVYATKRIQKGTLVWGPDNTACFEDGKSYRWFVGSIPEDLACDIFLWAYVGDSEVCVDLDAGSFINTAGGAYGDTPNVGMVDGEGQYATRDIEPGEEILTNYDTFEVRDGWKKFGLGKWEDDEYHGNWEGEEEEDEDDDDEEDEDEEEEEEEEDS